MKITTIYKMLILLLLLGVGLTSCLNDSKVEDQEYGLIDLDANKIVEIPATASHTYPIVSLPEGMKTFERELRLAADMPAQEDVIVNLEVVSDRTSILKTVRELLSDRFPSDVPDSEIKTFAASGVSLSTSITIPMGERSVVLPIDIDTDLLSGEPQFIVVKIKSVDNPGYLVSGNFGFLLLELKVKSKFEGNYVYNCLALGPYDYMAYVENGSTIKLNTVAPNVVETAAFTALFGPGEILQYEFDPTNSTIVNVNWVTFPETQPITVLASTYDAGTKTTYVKWESARWAGRPFEETFQRVD